MSTTPESDCPICDFCGDYIEEPFQRCPALDDRLGSPHRLEMPDPDKFTGNQSWGRAQTLLVRERMNPRVVMAVGGWNSFEALEPYLNAPTAEVVNQEFEKAGVS